MNIYLYTHMKRKDRGQRVSFQYFFKTKNTQFILKGVLHFLRT